MNYYNEIKNKLIDNEIYEKVKDYSKEKNKVKTYYEIGKLLSEAGKEYGKNIIKQYSEKLMVEVGKKYNERTLYRMRKFFEIFKNEKLTPLVTKLSWSHYIQLLSIKNIDETIYYINQTFKRNLSKRELQDAIKNNEYERLDDKTKEKIIENKKIEIQDFIKHPIIIKSSNNYDDISEKVLQELILEDIPSFLKELGEGYSFIENEYKIKVEDTFNYIDILLFNIKYNCYCVLELKTTKLKKNT